MAGSKADGTTTARSSTESSRHWTGDIAGGLTAAVIALPAGIGCGYLALSPLGPEYASAGALAGIYAAIFGTLIVSWLGGTPLQISGRRIAPKQRRIGNS